MTFRRVSGLVVVVALAQLSLARAPQVCASHHGASAPTSHSHRGMTMPEAMGRGAGEQTDTAPRDALPPCDHQGAASDCASMVSCATVTAEAQSLPPVAVTVPVRVAVARGVAYASTTPSPETPPPRV